MIYGSVCSGIEAASVAWQPLGWRAAFLSEIETFPRAVLQHHYPSTPLHGDFTTIRAGDYEPIDLLVGGTPCQSFSVAGLRGGLADERGNLALEFLALAGRLRPRWIVWENVPGVLSSGGGRDFGSFLGGLVELGYGFAYRVLDAQFFGLAQRRKRVFVVGHLGDWRRAWAVLSQPASLRWHSTPRREAGEGAAGGSGASAAFGISPDCFDRDGEGAGGTARERSGLGVEHELAYSLRAKRPGGVAALRAEGFDASEDGDCEPAIAVSVALRGREGGGIAELGDDCAHALRSSQGGGDKPHVLAFDARQSDVIQYGDQTGPLDTDEHSIAVAFDILGTPATNGAKETDLHVALRSRAPGASEASTTTTIMSGAAVRRLTPRECARLQGFPDDYLDITFRGRPAADGNKYRALGNSMAVPCMAWIGSRIAAQEANIRASQQAAA